MVISLSTTLLCSLFPLLAFIFIAIFSKAFCRMLLSSKLRKVKVLLTSRICSNRSPVASFRRLSERFRCLTHLFLFRNWAIFSPVKSEILFFDRSRCSKMQVSASIALWDANAATLESPPARCLPGWVWFFEVFWPFPNRGSRWSIMATSSRQFPLRIRVFSWDFGFLARP